MPTEHETDLTSFEHSFKLNYLILKVLCKCKRYLEILLQYHLKIVFVSTETLKTVLTSTVKEKTEKLKKVNAKKI